MQRRIGSLFALLAGIFWGMIGIFVRHFDELGLGSLEIAWLRIFVGFVLVGGYLLLFHRELLRIRWRDLWCFAGTGIGSLFFLNLTYYTAMQYTSLAVAGALLYTAPIFVMLMSALFFREKMTTQKLLALALAFGGCVLVSGVGSASHISVSGLLWGLGAGVSYALYSIFGRFAVKRGYGSWTMTFYSFAFCLLAILPFCRWGTIAGVASVPTEGIWILALGLFTGFLAYLCYGMALERMEGSRAAILASVEPIVAALVSVGIFHEPVGIGGVIGILLVLGAIALLSIKRRGDQG